MKDIVGVVLPITKEPYEIKIPRSLKTKQALNEYLIDLGVFHCDSDGPDDEIDVGYYWRCILLDYKVAPRPCILFRLSNGKPLPQNKLCQKWRADPWKKTYGPIVLLRIQQSNKCFKVDSYTLKEFKQAQRKKDCRKSQESSPSSDTDINKESVSEQTESKVQMPIQHAIDQENFEQKLHELYFRASPKEWTPEQEPWISQTVLSQFLLSVLSNELGQITKGEQTTEGPQLYSVWTRLKDHLTDTDLYAIVETNYDKQPPVTIHKYVNGYEVILWKKGVRN